MLLTKKTFMDFRKSDRTERAAPYLHGEEVQSFLAISADLTRTTHTHTHTSPSRWGRPNGGFSFLRKSRRAHLLHHLLTYIYPVSSREPPDLLLHGVLLQLNITGQEWHPAGGEGSTACHGNITTPPHPETFTLAAWSRRPTVLLWTPLTLGSNCFPEGEEISIYQI